MMTTCASWRALTARFTGGPHETHKAQCCPHYPGPEPSTNSKPQSLAEIVWSGTMWDAIRAVWANPYVRLLILILGIIALYYLLQVTITVWSSFLLAFLLAYLLNPIVTWMEVNRLHRAVGVLLTVFVFLMLGALLWYMLITVAAQFSAFLAELPVLLERMQELPFLIGRMLDPSFGGMFQQAYVTLQGFYLWLSEDFVPSLGAAEGDGGTLLAQLIALIGGGVQLSIILVLTVYLLYKYPAYNRSFMSFFPVRYRAIVEELSVKASFAVGGYIRGQMIIAFFVGVMTWLGLTFLGIPMASALGLLAGVFNIIPFFGPLIAAVPTALIAATAGFGEVIGALLVLTIANQIDANILTPIVFSRTIEVDPVTIIVAILLGSALFGLVGAILAVPVAVFLKLVYKDYYLTSAWYQGDNRFHTPSE
jgi:predicted PurR-regulated permease PerM